MRGWREGKGPLYYFLLIYDHAYYYSFITTNGSIQYTYAIEYNRQKYNIKLQLRENTVLRTQ